MTLKSFLNKYEDLTKELIRCNGCTIILLHSGEKYEIVKIGLNEEGILCETCQRNKRNVESVTRIKDNDKQIFQVPISAVVQNIPVNNNNKDNSKDNVDDEADLPPPINSINTSEAENQEKRRLRTKKV
jgi:hypothetical protein